MILRCVVWLGTALCLALCAVASASAETTADQPETVRWLHEYLQIDTTNPPEGPSIGGEKAAAEYLARILESEGIEAQLLTSPGGRTSLYARLSGPNTDGKAVVLVHHIDVVAAAGEWKVEPFSGRPLGGSLWGRGAIDVKSLGIAHLAAVLALKRENVSLQRDVIYLAVADEEQGGKEGTGWLLDAHPELFEGVEGVLNEGGSNRVLGDRLMWWGIETTQKRPLWLRVTARGRPGHASGFNPGSATHQLVIGLARLAERPLKYRVTDAARNYLQALAKIEGGGSERLAYHLDEIILPEGPVNPLPPGMPVFFVDTIQVTEIQNGRGSNVVAPTATASVDIRMLPDTDADALLAEIRELLGDSLEIETVLYSPPAAPSPTDHPLYQALSDTLRVQGKVIPTFISGVTDSRWFRERGIPAYGFAPFVINPADLRGIHAPNEHVPVDAFLRGVEMTRRVVLAWAADPAN